MQQTPRAPTPTARRARRVRPTATSSTQNRPPRIKGQNAIPGPATPLLLRLPGGLRKSETRNTNIWRVGALRPCFWCLAWSRPRPDLVECRRIERQQPARRDPLTAQAVEADGRPATLDPADDGGPVGQHRDVFAVAEEQLAGMKAKGASGQVASAPEVVHHGVDAPVFAGDRVPARHMPDDVVGQD